MSIFVGEVRAPEFFFVVVWEILCVVNVIMGGEMHFFPSLKTKNLSLSFLGCTENTAQPDGFPVPFPLLLFLLLSFLPSPVLLLPFPSSPPSPPPSLSHTLSRTHTIPCELWKPQASSPFCDRPPSLNRLALQFPREPGCSGAAVIEGGGGDHTFSSEFYYR